MIVVGFLVSLGAILLISKKNLPAALLSGAVLLGIFTQSIDVLYQQVIRTLTDATVIWTSLAMGIIPLIGGTMKQSGQIDSLCNNLRISKKYLLAISAALMGLLPMPGGALLSAPILEKGGQGVSGDLNSAINNWFRHVFILIYPLAPALIISAGIARLDIYVAIIHIFPAFILASLLGYFFFLKPVSGDLPRPREHSTKNLLVPLMIIFCAPALDFTIKRLFSVGSLATLISVFAALTLSISLSRKKMDLKKIILQMRPWNFSLIIVGMYLYFHIFQKSSVGDHIAALPLPPLMLSITAGFVLSVLTGRVMLPASVILPIYIASVGEVSPFIFSLIYTAIYFGYIISPVHPCLIVTCEYFRVPIKSLMARLAVPTLIMFAVVLSAAIIII